MSTLSSAGTDLPPLEFDVVEARMWGSKVAIPELSHRVEYQREIDGPVESEVLLRPRVRSREEFLRWQALVGAGPLVVTTERP